MLMAVLATACSKVPVTTEVNTGVLRGYVDSGVEYFLGIPYAQPPLGDLRWRPPQPVSPWSGDLVVQDNPAKCSQFIPVVGSLSGSEDCLYLNVWAPADKPDVPMPVMVWIHGGGFIAGQGSFTSEDGRVLAQQHNVVVVTLNYRLGIFGFLAHEALTSEEAGHPSSGNYGIEDQTAALRWVRDNISAFGGDPANVTIFGQSAGGVSVCTQLVSPQAAGLFHRAVIQSGTCEAALSTLPGVSALGARLANQTGCEGEQQVLACLRGKSAEAVANVLPADPTFAFGEGYTVWWPVLDGHVLPMQMLDAFRSGQFNRVPVINGSTTDEATLLVWLSHNLLWKPLQDEQYLDRLTYLVGSRGMADKVAQRYPLAAYDSAFEALSTAFSDGFFHCPTRHQSRALSRHVPTWEYSFEYDQAPFLVPGADLGAYHAAEIQYVFGNPMSVIRRTFDAVEQPLAESMMAYWTTFARTGQPDAGGLPAWPPYGPEQTAMVFDLRNALASEMYNDQCTFWEELPYLQPPYR
jgi:para-nitrobenzyl esterase